MRICRSLSANAYLVTYEKTDTEGISSQVTIRKSNRKKL
ncbi:hypothetical protein HMPREF0868_0583 [Mageeibacillus indolicus UPII9-5]|uniref:Uncharacterized protein n=1 Tax=Mageeibacillus indolicus (strain UPII9-5) TaxID=699246 RepID=D3R149_MAGIU|nr:hypothetical protein HMPREF0868_0583 [Mageeibacillus indolicus UPII9-5]